jgi:hypothetical protein
MSLSGKGQNSRYAIRLKSSSSPPLQWVMMLFAYSMSEIATPPSREVKDGSQ